MSFLKINPDLFLGVAELNRLRKFLDDDGFRKNILQNSASFGLIKNLYSDNALNNGRVERDLDTELGQKTIKIRELFGIDKNGNFLYSPQINGLQVPADSNWYWIKISYSISNTEKGTFSLSANGDLTDTSGTAELTKILRGAPDFPSRIKFANSVYNNLEYDILEVINNQTAVLQHPATNIGDTSFEPETGLKLNIVGTFTRGITVPTNSKYIFNYDSCTIQLVQETTLNVAPAYLSDEDFFIARIKSDGSTVVIQDKRAQFWETTGSFLTKLVDRSDNKCIGIESVQFNSKYSPADRNIVHVGWGMRSNNWSVDTSNNIVTFNSGLGGRYKTVADFNNGELNGYRIYYPNGKYDKVVGSIKQGSAINFSLDNFNIDNVSPDGGLTFEAGYIVVVPDCDTVEILFTPDPFDNTNAVAESFKFPVNELFGKCDVLVYKDDFVLYNVKYRYKTLKDFSEYKTIPSDTTGYLTEASFDDNGNPKIESEWVLYPYTKHETNGFIKLFNSPDSISHFRGNVYTGDKLGVNTVSSVPNTTTHFQVGVDKKYQKFIGNLSITDDVVFALSREGALGCSEFIFHFDATTFNIGSSAVIIADNDGTSFIPLKRIKQADVYSMMNIDGGISFKCTFDEVNGKWLVFQNYEVGKSFELSMLDVDINFINTNFDSATKMGKTRGFFGWQLHNVLNTGRVPVGYGSITETDIGTTTFALGDTDGETKHKLTISEMPRHRFKLMLDGNGAGEGGVSFHDDPAINEDEVYYTEYLGDDVPHNNMQPYYVVAYIKRTY